MAARKGLGRGIGALIPGSADNSKDEEKKANTIVWVLAIIGAIAAIAGIVLNAILPGNDYEFGKNAAGDKSLGIFLS